jgi:hypothetical protein
MTDKYLNFDEYIRQGEPITGGDGLKGQSANSPRQRIGLSVNHGQISTMKQ